MIWSWYSLQILYPRYKTFLSVYNTFKNTFCKYYIPGRRTFSICVWCGKNGSPASHPVVRDLRGGLHKQTKHYVTIFLFTYTYNHFSTIRPSINFHLCKQTKHYVTIFLFTYAYNHFSTIRPNINFHFCKQ